MYKRKNGRYFMAEFFKQLIAQLSAIWQKLSLQQKIITSSLVAFTILGLIGLLMWSAGTPKAAGMQRLYSDLQLEEAGVITQKLDDAGIRYKVENEGRTILVEAKRLYEARMSLAREGLPKSHGVGYELFDKTNLAMTDFVQKLNARRALEGELQRTIEGLEEVKSARVHIVVPEPTIFLDHQGDTKASIVVKTIPGQQLNKDQIRGISHLVSSSVDGLNIDKVSIIDYEGRLLSSPFGADETALASSRNLELQQKVETYLENSAQQMLSGVLGPSKAKVKIAADLDFDQVNKTMEQFDPESRVVRSEERNDENTKNAPDGDHRRERSLTNYEIDKTVQHIMQEIGNVKRLTIAVAVDGRYDQKQEEEEEAYVPRSSEELLSIEEMVKNAVGYNLARGDEIVVTNLQFANEFLRKQQKELREQERMEFWLTIAKYVAIFLIAGFFIFFLRYLARTLAEAMNPPVPEVEALGGAELIPDEIPEDVRHSSEVLERVEMLTHEEPTNIASIIRQWLNEQQPQAANK
ncbi:MAG: flagellar M-ring protein FliF [Chitinivibrionales bacterium]|nr:flagellar M-ring protein FliF [Chitinivibrionales bacterium]